MICYNCGQTISDNSNHCIYCGAPQTNGQPDAGTNPQYNMPPIPPQAQMPMNAPAAVTNVTKPRSAYWAALLHIFLGLFGFGYYYRGMNDKAKNCIIMLVVGILTSVIFGIGAVVITICEVINIVEAIKLFNGSITQDAYGRTLYMEF